MASRAGRWPEAATLGALVAYSWALLRPAQRGAGLTVDDVQLGTMAANALRWARGAAPLPLTFGWGHGPWGAYLTAPFVLAFGRTPRALEMTAAAFAALTIVATYAAGIRLFRSRLAGLCAAALLASSPDFLYLCLLPGSSGLRELPLALASLALCASACRGAKDWVWIAAGLSLGVALGCRWTMTAWGLGLAACLLAARPRLPSGTTRAVALAAVAAPLTPIVIAWSLHAGHSDYLLRHVMARENGASNIAFAGNLAERLTQAAQLPQLCSDPAAEEEWQWHWLAALSWAACAVGGVLAWRRRDNPYASWPWLLGTAYLLLSSWSPSQLRPAHLTPLLPLMALAAASPAGLAGRRRRWWAVAVAGLALAGAQQTRLSTPEMARPLSDRRADQELAAPLLTDSGFELCRWLDAHSQARLVMLVDRLQDYVSYCLVDPQRMSAEPSSLSPPAFQRDEWSAIFKQSDAYYVLSDARPPRNPDNVYYEQVLRQHAKRAGLRIVPVETFGRKAGRAGFLLVQARP